MTFNRVPHQINFPGYSGEELFSMAASTTDRRSGNGRFVRNVVERLNMKQGKRLLNYTGARREELQQITLVDVEVLFEDSDIETRLDKQSDKTIGF